MSYNADIVTPPERNGFFDAALRGSDLQVHSRDPEYELCFEMLKAGLPEGPIQFWRGTTPTISFKSVHRAAKWRVTLGDEFPKLVKRDTGGAKNRLRDGSGDSETTE